MSRPVTADHILFDECINAFRRGDKSKSKLFEGKSMSFLLSSFEINEEWDLGICKVHSAEKIGFPGHYCSFVSKVENPEWVGTHNSHLFGIALSAIVSFITHKPCKSTRDDYVKADKQLSNLELQQLGILNPILVAGPGAVQTYFSKERQNRIFSEVKELIELLFKLDYKKYYFVMQAIRLAHLSYINKKEDFGLAYLLIVSCIESIAQIVISRNEVKKSPLLENVWKEKAKNDNDFNELLKEYKDARGKNKYLKERYVKFILNYAPLKYWNSIVVHPRQELSEYLNEINEPSDFLTQNKGPWPSKNLSDYNEKEIESIISDSYSYRSLFIHRGKQPPHREPDPFYNKFFHEYIEWEKSDIKERILPSYQLLTGIAKFSTLNWLKKL